MTICFSGTPIRMIIQDELKQLVSQSVKLLGEALHETHGKKLYQEIESLRVKMKSARGKDPEFVQKVLEAVYLDLQKNDTEELHQKAKAFSLMLELINACEAAYRTHRLDKFKIKVEAKPEAIIYVFTSHPTESRSQQFLKLMSSVEALLIQSLDDGFETIRDQLFYFLKIAVRLSLSNNRHRRLKMKWNKFFIQC